MSLESRLKRRLKIARNLLRSPRVDAEAVRELTRGRGKAGCYVIWRRNDRVKPLYVGLGTSRSGVFHRMREHLGNRITSFRAYVADTRRLRGDLEAPMYSLRKLSKSERRRANQRVTRWIERNCRFQYIELDDHDGEAELLEKFLIAVVVPRLQYPTND